MAFQDCQATQEDKGLREVMVSLELLVQAARRAKRVPKDQQGLQDREVQMVHVEPEALEALQESQVQRDHQAMMAHPDQQEKGDPKDLKEGMGSQGLKDPMAQMAKMGCQVIQASGGKQVSKERQDLLDHLVLLDHRVTLEKLDQWETGVTQGHRALLVSKDFLEQQAKREPRVTQVSQVHQERRVLQGYVASEAAEAPPAPRALLD